MTKKLKIQTGEAFVKFYLKYEPLADYYASRLFNVEAISQTEEDMKQNFRIKLWKVIQSFFRAMRDYNLGKRETRVYWLPYVRFSMKNYMNDFIQDINRKSRNGWNTFVSIERDGFDFYLGTDFAQEFDTGKLTKKIDFKCQEFFIGGVDVLVGLDGVEKKAVLLVSKGYKPSLIDKVLSTKKGNTTRLLKRLRGELETKKDSMYERQHKNTFFRKENV